MTKTTLPPHEIQAVVERKLGPVSAFEPLPEGLESQAYGFRRGSARLVVRVGRAREGFRKDAFAWRTFSSAALPIPEIVSIDLVGDIAFCISRRARGAQVRDLGDAIGALSPAIFETLAELARTDTGAVTGFGTFDANGKAGFETWRAYLLRAVAPDFCDWGIIKDRAARKSIEMAILAVERLAPVDPPRRSLVHGDFGSANLIADGRAVTGVIDWDRALIGDGAYDEANLLFWDEECLRPLLSLLRARRAGDQDWIRKVLCYQLRICLEELRDSLNDWTPLDADWLIARCADLVRQARQMTD